MKNKFLVMGGVLLLALFFACGKGSDDHHDGDEHSEHADMDNHDNHGDHGEDGHLMKPQYKSVDAGSLKASFEFSTMKDHMKSMKRMGMDMRMDHKDMGDHHVTLTLLNKSDSKMNMDVKDLSFTITGPDGKTSTKKAHMMHKETMHHFGTDVHSSGAGSYKIKASFKHAGKSHSPEVTFKM